jgi:hypothetical protein
MANRLTKNTVAEVLGAKRRASKGEAEAPGPASFEARATRGHLRMRATFHDDGNIGVRSNPTRRPYIKTS